MSRQILFFALPLFFPFALPLFLILAFETLTLIFYLYYLASSFLAISAVIMTFGISTFLLTVLVMSSLPGSLPFYSTSTRCPMAILSRPSFTYPLGTVVLPMSLAHKCVWSTLPELGSDHLPIHIKISVTPIIYLNISPPSFNNKKAY